MVFFLFLIISVYSQDPLKGNTIKDEAKQLQPERWDGPVEFYGKVVDQYGNAVPKAEINYRLRYISRKMGDDVLKYKMKAGDDGIFKISGFDAELLTIALVEQIGYEPKDFNKGFHFDNLEKDRKHIPDPKNPIVFTIRKKDSAPTFIYREGMLCKIKNKEETYFSDIIYDQYWHSTTQSEFHARCHPDIKYTTVDNKEKQSYDVTLTVQDKDSGILEKNEKLFTAPEDGYAKELHIGIPYEMKDPLKKIFYLKGRGGKFYTRIEAEIKFSNVGKQIIDIDIKTYTNPYGSRNLEATEITGEEMEKLNKKVLVDYGYEK